MRAIPLLLALLFAGCVAAPPESEPTTPPPAVTPPGGGAATVFDDTIDFSEDPSGARQEVVLEFPSGARTFTFHADFTADAPVSTTRDLRIAIVDGDGAVLAECDLATNVVTGAEGRDCGPTTNNLRASSYTLLWEGFGTARAHVLVTAE